MYSLYVTSRASNWIWNVLNTNAVSRILFRVPDELVGVAQARLNAVEVAFSCRLASAQKSEHRPVSSLKSCAANRLCSVVLLFRGLGS